MSNQAVKTVSIANVHAKTPLGNTPYSVKIADSRKCISVYFGDRGMPINFTREQFEEFRLAFEGLDKFYQATKDTLLSNDERKNLNKIQRHEEKLVEQAKVLDQKSRAIALMKANPKMDWDTAMELAKQ